MSKIAKEEKIHDIALLFVKQEAKKRGGTTNLWQKEVELMMDDYCKAVEFMETAWTKREKD